MNFVEAYYKAIESGYTRELEILACNDKNPIWAYWFARDVPGADLNYCLEACKETEYYAKMQVHMMNEALL